MKSFDNNSFGDRQVMNVSTFMSSIIQNASSIGGSFQTPGRKRSSSAPRERTTSKDISMDKEKRQQTFREFIGRQVHTAEKKQQHVKDVSALSPSICPSTRFISRAHLICLSIVQLERMLKPKFTPKLCRKSMDMSAQFSQGEFLDRLGRDISRRTDAEAKHSVSVDNNCTFTPGINAKSKNLPARSVYEMSKGDLQRKENKHRMVRLKTEQEALAGLTFQPEISQRARSAGRSRLQLSTDSSLFLEKYRIDQEKLDEKRRSEQNERKQHELDGCTFQPRTKECPSYVKRIAKSMALARAIKPPTLPPYAAMKPDWK